MSFFKKNTASTLAAQPIRHPPQTRPCSAAQCADATPSSRARTAKKKNPRKRPRGAGKIMEEGSPRRLVVWQLSPSPAAHPGSDYASLQ